MLVRLTRWLADLPLRLWVGVPLLTFVVVLAAYEVVGEDTVLDHRWLWWLFRILILPTAAAALASVVLVAPAVLVARLVRRAWQEQGLV